VRTPIIIKRSVRIALIRAPLRVANKYDLQWLYLGQLQLVGGILLGGGWNNVGPISSTCSSDSSSLLHPNVLVHHEDTWHGTVNS
jgi:hypothetical protein